jgi:hypothetical protein
MHKHDALAPLHELSYLVEDLLLSRGTLRLRRQ